MGSRAVCIVAEGGELEFHYDHWAAQTMGLDAALDGAAETVRRVRLMAPVNGDVETWDGGVWFEGSMFIDLSSRLLVWTDWGESGTPPRVLNRLIEHTWPGWRVLWSSEGLRGILQTAGIDPRRCVGPMRDDAWADFDPTPGLLPPTEWSSSIAVSVCTPDGAVRCWGPDLYLEGLAAAGPDAVLGFAAQMAPGVHLTGPEWSTAGIHLDTSSRSARWWAHYEEASHLPVFERRWPGWTVESMGDRHEWHEAQVEGLELRPPWAEEIAAVADSAPAVFSPPDDDLRHTTSAVARRAAEQPDDDRRPPRGVKAERLLQPELMVLLEHLRTAPPLPPAAYVDRHGQVHRSSTS